MVDYSKVNVKLWDTQLKKLKTAVRNKSGTALRISLKMFNGNDLSHELLLITRQKTKLGNVFNNNMSTDLKLSKAQISKMIQSGGFLGSLLSKLADPLMKVVIPLGKTVLAPLGITVPASAIDAGIQKKMYGSGTATFKRRNEWQWKLFKLLKILIFYWKESLKQLKMKQKKKKEDF